MRDAFAEAITELAGEDKEIVLLVGDIGNRMFDKFQEKFPTRFYNCGIAEAGMTGIAAGLAACGMKPVTYTITPFNTLRCIEQIRNDVCYPNLPVVIVGTGSGLSYAGLGATHHSMEDIAVMRILPNMQVVCPGDPVEVKLVIKAAMKSKSPTYIRLGKKGEKTVHQSCPEFEIGKAITIKDSRNIMLISVGNVLPVLKSCLDKFTSLNIDSGLISMHTVKPLDSMSIKKVMDTCKLVVVVEEHNLAAGAGSAILEFCNKALINTRKLLVISGGDTFLSGCGTQEEARYDLGITVESIVEKSINHMEKLNENRV